MKERVYRLIARGISNKRRRRTFTFGLHLLIEEERVLRFLPTKPLGRARSVHFLESVNRGLLKVKKERKQLEQLSNDRGGEAYEATFAFRRFRKFFLRCFHLGKELKSFMKVKKLSIANLNITVIIVGFAKGENNFFRIRTDGDGAFRFLSGMLGFRSFHNLRRRLRLKDQSIKEK